MPIAPPKTEFDLIRENIQKEEQRKEREKERKRREASKPPKEDFKYPPNEGQWDKADMADFGADGVHRLQDTT